MHLHLDMIICLKYTLLILKCGIDSKYLCLTRKIRFILLIFILKIKQKTKQKKRIVFKNVIMTPKLFVDNTISDVTAYFYNNQIKK